MGSHFAQLNNDWAGIIFRDSIYKVTQECFLMYGKMKRFLIHKEEYKYMLKITYLFPYYQLWARYL